MTALISIIVLCFCLGMLLERYLARRRRKRDEKRSADLSRTLSQVADNIDAKYGGKPHRADVEPIRKPK